MPSNAVDHLSCLRAVLGDAKIINMYAPFTLVRGCRMSVFMLTVAANSGAKKEDYEVRENCMGRRDSSFDGCRGTLLPG